jgi:hypothetical protein
MNIPLNLTGTFVSDAHYDFLVFESASVYHKPGGFVFRRFVAGLHQECRGDDEYTRDHPGNDCRAPRIHRSNSAPVTFVSGVARQANRTNGRR